MRATAWLLLGCMAIAAVKSAPAPEPNPEANPQPDPADDSKPEIIEIIAPANDAQETLATLNLGSPGSEMSERNKRTIGILRQLFPQLTQTVEQIVQQITGQVIQALGPVVLRAFLGNRGGGGGNGGTGGGTIELDDDEDEDEDEDDKPATTSTELPEKLQSSDIDENDEERRRKKRALYFWNVADENQLLNGAESQQAEVRVAFGENQGQDQQPAASEQSDQQTAAQGIDEISLDDADSSEENRNKRSGFLNFGGSAGSSGGGGGSGNFLFDIVRRPAEAVARAAGTAFRIFAGTDSLNLGLTASHTGTFDPNDPQLVAGSSSGSSGGDTAAAEGEGDDAGAAKGDNLTEGVPGPITRLFIIANRGIANLIQDLILRLAQTSERIVNFKARLITSII